MVKKPTPHGGTGGEDDEDNGAVGGRGMRIDPLVKALLGHLPPPKSVWPPKERQDWLALLGQALGVIYRDTEPPKPAPAPGQHAANPPTGQHPPGSVSTTR